MLRFLASALLHCLRVDTLCGVSEFPEAGVSLALVFGSCPDGDFVLEGGWMWEMSLSRGMMFVCREGLELGVGKRKEVLACAVP